MRTLNPSGMSRGGNARRDGRSEADRIRGSRAWRKLSEYLRKRWPVCCDPLRRHPERVEATTLIHHILSVESTPSRALDASNTAPLCRACHDAIEALEASGTQTNGYFVVRHWE